MQKNKSIKIAIILVGLIAITAGIILTVYFLSNKTESYRSILIYQLEGSAEIEREGTGTITAANNLYLESGDTIRLDSDSSMRLKLDDDKYILVEENSILSIQAEGSDEDSKTSICLEQGAITNEIQNKLTEQSTYEVNSPNSIMAVRGTIFRAEGYTDEEGRTQTKISTFDGTVAFQPIAPDGTKQDEILIEAGNEAVIQSTPDGIQYLKEPSGITFSDLPSQALYFLLDLMENGSPVTGISQDDLAKLIQELENKDETDSETDSEDKEPSEQSSTPESDSSDPGSSDGSTSNQPSTNNSTSSGQDSPTATPSGQSSTTKVSSEQNTPTKTPSGQSSPTTAPSEQNTPTKAPSGQSSPTTAPSGQSSPTKTPSGQNSPTKAPSEQSSPTKTPSEQSSPTKTPSEQSSPTKTPSAQSTEDPTAKTYTVTFRYQGTVFGIQTVESGHTASEPKLKPSSKGSWDFDFSQGIYEDVVINWISK